ncbi:MAG: c-type cytochrome [Pseudolabrys sp.]
MAWGRAKELGDLMHSARSYGFLAGALLLAAALAGGWREPSFAQTPTPAKPNAAPALHGKKLVEAYCVSCHGVDGNTTADPQYPKLADQKATYLRLQLLAFRSGARKSDIMSGPAHALTDSQIG